VILLDFRVIDQIATRRLRVVKYRGSTHGTNEYPFLIDEHGISVLPITSLKLEHIASTEILSTGLHALDKLFYSGGIFRGNSTLISGTAGTAKTILAAYFAIGSCARDERTIFFSFEESPDQLIRNMASAAIDLQKYINAGLLQIHSILPSLQGLEMHLLHLYTCIRDFKPRTVIIDPISSLIDVGSTREVKGMLVRLMYMLKQKQVNAVITSLTHHNSIIGGDRTEDIVSSIADTWIKVSNEENDRTILRSLFIVKSRGTGHSGQLSNFIITNEGLVLLGDKQATHN
jgi:circadian clock protein KaiC